MRLFGLEISRAKRPATEERDYAALARPGDVGSGWFPIIRESFSGAWQQGVNLPVESVASYHAVYACVTLIAQDVSKMRLRMGSRDANNIWSEQTQLSPLSAVLNKPNRYQNSVKFIEQWIISKLMHGNTYALKERDQRGVVTNLYILHPARTRALVTVDGGVYYQLSGDDLAGVDGSVIVPANEIIHDTMVPLYHPLCGVSPITACGLAAAQGLAIQRNQTNFFTNGSRPGGILTAPGVIDKATADRLKEHWDQNYTGANVGRVAVLGGGLKYETMVMSAVDAQLIDQLKWAASAVCSAFHVPPYMIGVGETPKYDNIEALNQQYYSQALQSLVVCIQECLNAGLNLANPQNVTYSVRFDLDDLLMMDTATKMKTISEGVLGGVLKPNEGRAKFDLAPVVGGDQVFLQQQNFSLLALSKRDAKDDPFASSKPPADTPPIVAPANDNPAKARSFAQEVRKSLGIDRAAV